MTQQVLSVIWDESTEMCVSAYSSSWTQTINVHSRLIHSDTDYRAMNLILDTSTQYDPREKQGHQIPCP